MVYVVGDLTAEGNPFAVLTAVVVPAILTNACSVGELVRRSLIAGVAVEVLRLSLSDSLQHDSVLKSGRRCGTKAFFRAEGQLERAVNVGAEAPTS